MQQQGDFLPISKQELERRGWDYVDVIIVSGDAYVDHPSFGHAVIARTIESCGCRVAILPQPNWRDDLRDFKKLGKPRYFFGITAGCMDSMVNHYTANKRLRSDDAYTPGNQSGFRPDYATVVYSKILKQLFPDVPVVIGGIEASLRRFTHYDYWQDAVKPSILVDSQADLLVYGMGELPIKAIVDCFQKQQTDRLHSILQVAYLTDTLPANQSEDVFTLHSHEDCMVSKRKFAENFAVIERESNKLHPKTLVQAVGKQWVVVNPTFPPMSEKQIDESFDLPYTRMPHPRYAKRGDIPAFEMIKNSVNIHRGCFGGCSFCAISAHQGKFIASRSEKSILNELNKVASMPYFKGHISDLGAPSANMYRMHGKDQSLCSKCSKPSCIYPKRCANLNADHHPLLSLYQRAAAIKGIKKITIGSGIRYDMLLSDNPEEVRTFGFEKYIEAVVGKHVSGRLKVAPEHTNAIVLKQMRKANFENFHRFKQRFDYYNRKFGLRQQLIPYFISSHPACTLEYMAELAAETKKMGFRLEQVQDFTPTPTTYATTVYYTGLDPYTLKPVYTARSPKEKQDQLRFFFWFKPENRKWIETTLRKIHRQDLIDMLLR